MPYFISDKAEGCSGWATIKADGEVLGCHKTKTQAIAQMIALSLSENIKPGGNIDKDDKRIDSGPQAVIVDIDGTLIQNGRRVEKVYNFLDDMDDTSIFIVTGRNTSDRESTIAQLDELSIDYNRLFMNPGSTAETAEFKKATAENLLKEYNVILAIDNNATMRKVYRDLGITALDVPDVPSVPSDEEDDDEESSSRAVSLTPPAYMRAAARRGLELNREGAGGDGLKQKTIREARNMAAGNVSEDKWRRIGPWIARHLVDLDAPKNSNPDDPQYPGPGLVAHLLWGSGPSKARAIAAMNYAMNLVEKLDENKRHLPGGHDQLTHGSGAGGGYKSGAWKKANESDKQAILERQYGQAADLAQGNLSREQKINSLAKMDNNDDLLKAEVYINGTHSVAFKGTSKSIDSETKQEILKDVDNLQTIAPLDSLQVDVVARIPSNVAKNPNLKVSGYTHSNGKKIVLMKDAAADRDTLAGTKIQLADPDWHMPTYRNTVSKGTYTLSHEWGHAVDLQKNKSGTLDFENKVDMAVKRGLSSGGFISKYGKTNLSEAYAEGFAEFVSTNKSTNNPVVAELAKEFSW